MHLFSFLRLATTGAALFAAFALGGCGGGTAVPQAQSAVSLEQHSRTYVADLDRVMYWESPTVTYRILTPAQRATDIHQAAIPCLLPRDEQVESIREGLQKWQTALEGKRQFTEVSPDHEANIDIVVQSAAQFNVDTLGVTTCWIKDSSGTNLGRSVVRLNGELSAKVFRRTTLHETGHALFASGHSKDARDVMSKEFDPQNPLAVLSPRDVETIRAAYANQ